MVLVVDSNRVLTYLELHEVITLVNIYFQLVWNINIVFALESFTLHLRMLTRLTITMLSNVVVDVSWIYSFLFAPTSQNSYRTWKTQLVHDN